MKLIDGRWEPTIYLENLRTHLLDLDEEEEVLRAKRRDLEARIKNVEDFIEIEKKGHFK